MKFCIERFCPPPLEDNFAYEHAGVEHSWASAFYFSILESRPVSSLNLVSWFFILAWYQEKEFEISWFLLDLKFLGIKFLIFDPSLKTCGGNSWFLLDFIMMNFWFLTLDPTWKNPSCSPLDDTINNKEQTGAELCQAQVKLRLAKLDLLSKHLGLSSLC